MIAQWVRRRIRAIAEWVRIDDVAGYQPTSGPANPAPPQGGSATSPRPGAGEPPAGPAPTPTASPNGNGTGHYAPAAKLPPKLSWCGCEITMQFLVGSEHSVLLTTVRGKLHARRICLVRNKVQDTLLEQVPPAAPLAPLKPMPR